jgi:hypothetical protein
VLAELHSHYSGNVARARGAPKHCKIRLVEGMIFEVLCCRAWGTVI